MSGNAEIDALIGRVIGGFDVIERMAEGRDGPIYRAHQARLDRDVAFGVLDPVRATADPELAARFARKATVGARLDHPAIVPTFAAGTERGVSFVARRLVSGPTLGSMLDESDELPAELVRVVMAWLTSALAYAHGLGIAHGGLAADVVYVGTDRVWLSDFEGAASADPVVVAEACAADGEALAALGDRLHFVPDAAPPTVALDAAAAWSTTDPSIPPGIGTVAATGGPFVPPPPAASGVVPRPPVAPPFARPGPTPPQPTPADDSLAGLDLTAAANDAPSTSVGSNPSEQANGDEGATPTGASTRSRWILAVAAFVAVVVIGAAALAVHGSEPDLIDHPTTLPGASSQPGGTADVSAPATTPPPGSSAAPPTSLLTVSADLKGTGPARIQDQLGVSYELPAGWAVGDVVLLKSTTVNMVRGDDPKAAFVSVRPSNATIDAFVAENQKYCTTNKEDASFDGFPAVHCWYSAKDTPDKEQHLWFVTTGKAAIAVGVSPSVPGAERHRFVQNVSITP